MTKPRLTMLKPRLAPAPSKITTMSRSASSWRSGKQGGTARGYNYRWQKARERFLSEHPLCRYCERLGKVTAATVVDHIVPHEGDESRFWDESNWQALCKPCHDSAKKKEEARGWINV